MSRPATHTTTYTRNILGNVTGITQGSITRSFGYDATKKNFLTTETNPETGTINYGRDNVGNMTSKIDASGTTSYGYDNINRQTSINSNISFGYDNANNRTTMTYPGGSATYTYDAANRQTQKSETIGSKSYTTGYGYDGNDNMTPSVIRVRDQSPTATTATTRSLPSPASAAVSRRQLQHHW